ncbi:CarD family transcriptional regulator [Alkalicoccus urumqiensis]|uniref:CarD-like/TRCF RNAP-interacting domain-containing protein n=1 Tax=Alkalicoccus urumqiensis TaxID=1548213 RepID=A0A2P6MFQ9_ALKUR|nr:CarD family transcriptional regulator [Alkalicoccus urumqiensis]PRO65124.1 hypothetical protein C6I21_11800 [Alkalicoccus urumqiensis]
MYSIGDPVVYPGQGAGTITDVVSKTILGKKQDYFEVYFPLQRVTLSLPESSVDASGLRPITDPQKLRDVLYSYTKKEPVTEFKKPSRRPDQRLCENNLNGWTDVYFELCCKDAAEGVRLHSEEKKAFELASRLLVSEVSLSCGLNSEEAATLVRSNMYSASSTPQT